MQDDQFTTLSKQLTNLNDGFLKLYQHMEERFSALETKVDAKADRDQVERLRNIVDGIAGDVSDIKDEHVVRNPQVDRRLDQHQGWIKQLADHSQVKLESLL
jgi:hypothetical protein